MDEKYVRRPDNRSHAKHQYRFPLIKGASDQPEICCNKNQKRKQDNRPETISAICFLRHTFRHIILRVSHLTVNYDAEPARCTVCAVFNPIDLKSGGHSFFRDHHIQFLFFREFQQFICKFFRFTASCVRHKRELSFSFKPRKCHIIFCKLGKHGAPFFFFFLCFLRRFYLFPAAAPFSTSRIRSHRPPA